MNWNVVCVIISEVLPLSAIYCGGYSGEDPPLPIPNREVKLTIADGTDPPVGRVGSCRSSKGSRVVDSRALFLPAGKKQKRQHLPITPPQTPPSGRGSPAEAVVRLSPPSLRSIFEERQLLHFCFKLEKSGSEI